MNIFYLDKDVTTCARYHVDKHVVKMIVEYCQLLSTAHRVLDGNIVSVKTETGRTRKVWQLNSKLDDVLYKATHINHPSAVWVRKSKENYKFLYSLLVELCKEYTHRYQKKHASEKLLPSLKITPINISAGEFEEPTPAMPECYIVSNDSKQSYRNYYIFEKKHIASWKNRQVPHWYKL